MPLASVALLWTNRLLSDDIALRADIEARYFWAAWAAATAWGMLRVQRGKPWRDLFGLTAALLLALPVLNAITRPRSSLFASLADHDWVLVAVDLSALALGMGFMWLSWLASGPRHRERSRDLIDTQRPKATPKAA